MNEKIIILYNSLRRDLQVIEQIYADLGENTLDGTVDERDLIVAAYRLHNLFSAFENMFVNIAAVFENSIDEGERWHMQLLERMTLNAMPLRPNVIDEEAYEALDELRRFRHLFRHAYGKRLHADRLNLVLQRVFALKKMYKSQIETFLQFLQTFE
jgi:hypothetical protein